MSKKLSLTLLLSITSLYLLLIIGIFTVRNTTKTSMPSPKFEEIVATATQSSSIETFNEGKMDINTATVADLVLLPGIGDTLANRIVEYRESHGPFKTIDELIDVSGIGPAKLAAITEYITVGG